MLILNTERKSQLYLSSIAAQAPLLPHLFSLSGLADGTDAQHAQDGLQNRDVKYHSGKAKINPVPALLRDLSALKAAVIGACALTAALIACLLLRVFRSGKRIKKTRKYDIITTPAERVEMAPLNEEDDEDEDSTVFDVKYRYCFEPVRLGLLTELLLVKTVLFFSTGPAWQR
uniref:Family with sequence similarity 174 member B n=1 Tax=Strix occidentalis caurina TaxID=311401 RepID=A0A8D0ELJ4_STROC